MSRDEFAAVCAQLNAAGSAAPAPRERRNATRGRVKYPPGTPKGTPDWVWVCACAECEKLPVEARLQGPFKTERAAMKDHAACLLSLLEGFTGQHH
jgi:hypothetical protein